MTSFVSTFCLVIVATQLHLNWSLIKAFATYEPLSFAYLAHGAMMRRLLRLLLHSLLLLLFLLLLQLQIPLDIGGAAFICIVAAWHCPGLFGLWSRLAPLWNLGRCRCRRRLATNRCANFYNALRLAVAARARVLLSILF